MSHDAPAQRADGGPTARRVLVAGSFSIDKPDNPVTTAGDLLALRTAQTWLDRARIGFDVAYSPPFTGGVDWRTVEPEAYSHVLWVCGPVGQGRKQTRFRERFRHARQVGLDVTMLDHLQPWNPFDELIERDSATHARPDISLLAPEELPPVVGLCLISRQRHYAGARHDAVRAGFERLIASRPMSVVAIDTVIRSGQPGQRTPEEVTSLLARVDVVLTNRLHGLVLSIKHGVPVVAVDGVSGGAKVTRQATALGWPAILSVDSLTEEAVQQAFDYCLSNQARVRAREVAERARTAAAAVEGELLAALAGSPAGAQRD
jgi:hypothetical protein